MLYENGEFERIRPHLTPLECGIIFDGIPEGAISRKVGLIWGIPAEAWAHWLAVAPSIPFRTEDVGGGNEFISPFGIIGHSRDAGHGHGGIDILLNENAPLFAVADGTILSAEESSDGAGGFDVKLLISGTGGEGWGFLYEHIQLESAVHVGSAVTKGQLIGRNGLTTDRRNSHLQLTYMFNDYEFYRDQRCWVDHLDSSSKKSILDYFDSIKTTEKFIAQWQNASEEGMKALSELLNIARFPEGPQLCYTLGLDVRLPE